jgi:hypothetical protein
MVIGITQVKLLVLLKSFYLQIKVNKFSLVVRTLWSKISDTEYADVDKEIFVSVGGGMWALTKGRIEEKNPHF